MTYRHPQPVTDQALEWFLLFQGTGGFSADDLRRFELWLADHDDHRAAFAQVKDLWNCPELTLATATLDMSSMPTPLARMDRVSRSGPWGRLRPTGPGFAAVAFAASILFAVAMVNLSPDWLAAWTPDHATGAGEITTVVLPDGSQMQMNSRTAVSLDFNGNHRKVRLLEGEAWFDVVHDAARPFTVTGGYGTVRVTGTSFDVARSDAADRVHLLTGRIELTHRLTEQEPVILSPGQRVAVDARRISEIATFDPHDSSLAWREGWIVLAARPLRDALAEIGRYSKTRIVTMGSSVLDIPVSGTFRIEDADAAIDSIVTAAGGTTDHLPGGFVIIR